MSPYVPFPVQRQRYDTHQCMDCGAPEEFRSESPDGRLEASYCGLHCPCWLRNAHARSNATATNYVDSAGATRTLERNTK